MHLKIPGTVAIKLHIGCTSGGKQGGRNGHEL
jgi:hypothetical protein